jgi:hypothetical protein
MQSSYNLLLADWLLTSQQEYDGMELRKSQLILVIPHILAVVG